MAVVKLRIFYVVCVYILCGVCKIQNVQKLTNKSIMFRFYRFRILQKSQGYFLHTQKDPIHLPLNNVDYKIHTCGTHQ